MGVLTGMIMGGSRSQIEGGTGNICDQEGCNVSELEKSTQLSNCVERAIQKLKNDTKRYMVSTNDPPVFWCLCLDRRAEMNN